MADINNTIRDYKELQTTIKILLQNQKDLNAAIKNTKVPGEYKKYQQDLAEVNFELDQTRILASDAAYVLTNELGSNGFDALTGNGQVLTEQLKKMKSAMSELALAGKQDSDVFRELQLEAIAMQTQITMVNRSINDMANNDSLGTLSGQFGALGSSILSMDFTTATRQASALANTLGAISWTTAISGAKSFGTSIVQLGKTLLASPMFIIGGVIVGISLAIYKLLKEAGVLTLVLDGLNRVLEVLMIPLNLLINGFKNLTDAIGLTNNTEKDLNIQRAKEAERSVEQANLVNGTLQKTYDNRIYLLGKELDAIKDTDEGALESRLTIQDKINEAMKRKYEFEEATRLTEYTKAKADLAAFLSEYDNDINKVIKKDEEKYNKLTDLVYSTKNAYKDATWNVEVKAEVEGSEVIKKIRDGALEDEKTRIKEAQQAREAYLLYRIQTARRIASLEIDALNDGIDKEITKLKQHWKEFNEDIKRDTKLTTDERRQLLILGTQLESKQIRDIKQKEQDDINDIIDKAINERIKLQKKQQDEADKAMKNSMDVLAKHRKRSMEMDMTTNEKAKQEIIDYYAGITKEIMNTASTTGEAIRLMGMLNAQMNVELSKIPKDTFISKNIDDINKLTDILRNAGGEYGGLFSNMADIIGTNLIAIDELLNSNFESTSEKIVAYSQLIGSTINSVLTAMSDELNNQLNYDIESFQASMNDKFSALESRFSASLITQQEYNEAKTKLEIEANKKENDLRRKAFEDDKKFRIAQATITMLQGMIGAFAQANATLPPPAGAIVGGILAAAVGAMGGINIAKIKGTQYASSASKGGSMSSSVGGIGSASTAMAAPTFNFGGSGNDKNTSDLGNGSNGNNGTDNDNDTSGKTPTIDITGKVVVSVTDINNGIAQVKTQNDYNSLLGGE